MQEVETDPASWTRGADAWFMTGDAYAREMPAVFTTPITTMKVNAPVFSNIKSRGDFQVQIFGTDGPNTVYVYGPNDVVGATLVSVKGDTLYLNKRTPCPNINKVIVRIGIHRLNSIVQLGRGRIEGIRLRGDCVTVTSWGSGNVYLAGSMNLKLLQNFGSGCISIFGANSPELDIKTSGSGTTNVSGNLGVKTINHIGTGCINVIGANSDGLRIYAHGSGKIGVNGIVNLCDVTARGTTRIYVCKVSSGDLHAYAYDNARIGLAGIARNLYVDAYSNSCVGLGKLCADNAYVRAYDTSHVNVAAWKAIFASSSGSSSIYYFGPSNDILTQFVSDNGMIIPVGRCSGFCPPPQPPRRDKMMVGAG